MLIATLSCSNEGKNSLQIIGESEESVINTFSECGQLEFGSVGMVSSEC